RGGPPRRRRRVRHPRPGGRRRLRRRTPPPRRPRRPRPGLTRPGRAGPVLDHAPKPVPDMVRSTAAGQTVARVSELVARSLASVVDGGGAGGAGAGRLATPRRGTQR